ncbi:MAG: hypothetical protein VX278_20975, partial [Myxococcota bacterium]|nr:hypothetical protein [Myxococcota bacterium]
VVMFFSLILVSFFACNGEKKESFPADSGIKEPSTEPTWTGEFLLVHEEANTVTQEYTTVYGVFVDSQTPYWYNSLCMFFQICDEIAEDEIIEITASGRYSFEDYLPQDIGQISFNGVPLSTDLYLDNYGLEIYSNLLPLTYSPSSTYDVELPEGEFVPNGYAGNTNNPTPDIIDITSHDTMSWIQGNGFGAGLLFSERTLTLEWIPQYESFYILIHHNDYKYITKTEDDGIYELNFNDWNLSNDGTVSIFLLRMSEAEMLSGEQAIQSINLSTQALYTSLTSQDLVDNPPEWSDSCSTTTHLTPITTGYHKFGGQITTAWSNDVDTECTLSNGESNGSAGVDAWTKVRLNAGETIFAGYAVGSSNAVLYLSESCSDHDTCLDISDYGGQTKELIQYTNEDNYPKEYFLGMDLGGENAAATSLPKDYILDIWIGALSEAPIGDACSTAEVSMPLTTGSHYYKGIFDSFRNDLDSANNDWTLYGSSGPDAILPVKIEPGEKIQVNFTLEQNDAVIYLIDNCSDEVGTMVKVASDLTINGNPESYVYWNTSGEAERLYVGLDIYETPQEPHIPNDLYTLSVIIE